MKHSCFVRFVAMESKVWILNPKLVRHVIKKGNCRGGGLVRHVEPGVRLTMATKTWLLGKVLGQEFPGPDSQAIAVVEDELQQLRSS